jgi:hypothetical protein
MELSILKHWIGPRTFASIFVSGVAGWNTVTNMHLLMDDPTAVGTVLAFLVAGLVTWWIIGSDSYKANQLEDKRDAQYNDLKKSIEKQRQLPVPTKMENISEWSDEALSKKAFMLAALLRQKEKVFLAEREQAKHPFDHGLPGISDGRASLWERQVSDFEKNVLPDALSIRNEFLKRIPSYRTPMKFIAIDFGSLAGPRPLNDAADVFEDMARILT